MRKFCLSRDQNLENNHEINEFKMKKEKKVNKPLQNG